MMTGQAKIMFLWPTSKYDIIGDVVQLGEGGNDPPSHVAVILPTKLLEATALGIRKTDLHKYDSRRREVWAISVPNIEFTSIAVQLLLGRKYSYIADFSGLVRDRFNIKLPLVKCCQDDCSESGTIFLDCLGRDLFNGDDPSGITPKDLLLAIKQWGGSCIEKWPIVQN